MPQSRSDRLSYHPHTQIWFQREVETQDGAKTSQKKPTGTSYIKDLDREEKILVVTHLCISVRRLVAWK